MIVVTRTVVIPLSGYDGDIVALLARAEASQYMRGESLNLQEALTSAGIARPELPFLVVETAETRDDGADAPTARSYEVVPLGG